MTSHHKESANYPQGQAFENVKPALRDRKHIRR